MLMKDYTAAFFNLEDVVITNVENISDQLHICIELPLAKTTPYLLQEVQESVDETKGETYTGRNGSACPYV